jgi:hypothetical protein
MAQPGTILEVADGQLADRVTAVSASNSVAPPARSVTKAW